MAAIGGIQGITWQQAEAQLGISEIREKNGTVFRVAQRIIDEAAVGLPVVGLPELVAQMTTTVFGAEAFEVLELLGIEMNEVPPLPDDIQQTLYSPCSLYPGYMVGETHRLLLIPGPQEGKFTTFNQLMDWVIIPAGVHLFGEENPLRCVGWPEAIQELGNAQLPPAHWVLVPVGPNGNKGIFPETKSLSYDDQVQKIHQQNNQYEVSSFQDLALAYFFLRARGEDIFSCESDEIGRTSDVAGTQRWRVGLRSDGLSGLFILPEYNFVRKFSGAGALLKLRP